MSKSVDLLRIAARMVASAKKVRTISYSYTEPEDGHHVITADLTDEEADRVLDVFQRLENGAGDSWGEALASWAMDSDDPADSEQHFSDLDSLLGEIALQSRYAEDEEMYGVAIEALQGR